MQVRLGQDPRVYVSEKKCTAMFSSGIDGMRQSHPGPGKVPGTSLWAVGLSIFGFFLSSDNSHGYT